jgi:multiple sugar transport system substrate-binding protein
MNGAQATPGRCDGIRMARPRAWAVPGRTGSPGGEDNQEEQMALNRRQFLIGGLGAATSMGLTACGGGSSGGGGGANGSADLQFAYWSNDVRTKNTTAAINAYTKAHPTVKISQQPGEFSSYWDKLATQTAGNKAPDIIQMDMAYIAEYGKRNALLDLAKHDADTSKFVEGSVDSGKIDGKLVGVNAGINSPTILANPKIFEQAKVQLPDDTTWTWDQLKEVAAEITAKAGNGIFGLGVFFNDAMFSAFLRQHGKELFTENGVGFEAADAVPWFDMVRAFQTAKAIPSASQLTEETTKPVDQSALAVGKGAMQMQWSNQVEALNKAAGGEMRILRFPSMSGKATERKAWYKASMLWSASSRTKYPDQAVALINWWVNSPECANINLAERGIPANTEILTGIKSKLSPAQAAVAKFIEDIKPELSSTPVAPPPGGGKLNDTLNRYQTDVLFGRAQPADAAAKFVDEVKSNLK